MFWLKIQGILEEQGYYRAPPDEISTAEFCFVGGVGPGVPFVPACPLTHPSASLANNESLGGLLGNVQEHEQLGGGTQVRAAPANGSVMTMATAVLDGLGDEAVA